MVCVALDEWAHVNCCLWSAEVRNVAFVMCVCACLSVRLSVCLLFVCVRVCVHSSGWLSVYVCV